MLKEPVVTFYDSMLLFAITKANAAISWVQSPPSRVSGSVLFVSLKIHSMLWIPESLSPKPISCTSSILKEASLELWAPTCLVKGISPELDPWFVGFFYSRELENTWTCVPACLAIFTPPVPYLAWDTRQTTSCIMSLSWLPRFVAALWDIPFFSLCFLRGLWLFIFSEFLKLFLRLIFTF